MDDVGARQPDPLRDELDRRWEQYLATGRRAGDHDAWLVVALSTYRDEIVHFGAQILNDLSIRPWDEVRARAGFERYDVAARDYDADPDAWEEAFWARARATPLHRDLTPQERTFLESLLVGRWDGAEEARAQLETAKYWKPWFEGSPSFDLRIDPHGPLIPLPDGILAPSERVVNEGGAAVGGVMLWLSGGRMSALEYYWTSEQMPASLPAPESLSGP